MRKEKLPKQDPYVIEHMDQTAGKIIIDGNAAAGMGAVFAGVTVVAWYPITPSTSLIEATTDMLEEIPRHPRRQGDFCRGAGGRRTGRHRHGARRRMGRCPFHDFDLGPWHFPHVGVRGPWLFRGDPGRYLRRAAYGAFDWHADPHFAGRPALHSLSVSRRYQAHRAAPGLR